MYDKTKKVFRKTRNSFQRVPDNFSKNLVSKLVISSLALPLTLISTVSESEAAIIKKYDFESGNYSGVGRQYQDKTCSKSSDYIDNSLFQIVDAPGGRTGKAVRHHIANCDERSELVVNSGFLKTKQEYWVGWSYFFPKDFIKPNPGKPNYTIVQQMPYKDSWVDQDKGKTLFECNPKHIYKGYEKTGGSPGSEIVIAPNGTSYTFKMKYYKGQDSQGRYIFGCQNFSIPTRLEGWEDFVMNFVASDNKDEGYLKLWKNDKLYIDAKVALSRPGVDAMGDWKIGAYTGDPGHGERTVYTDELRVGDGASNYLDVVAPTRQDKLLGLESNNSTISSFATADLMSLATPVASNRVLQSFGVTPVSSISPAAPVPEPSMLVGLLTLGGAVLSLGLKRN